MNTSIHKQRNNENGAHDHHSYYPIAHPIASVSEPPPTTVNSPTLVTNDGAHQGTTPRPEPSPHPRPYRSVRTVGEISDRDEQILRSIAEHRFLTARHVQSLHFADHAPISGGRIARRALASLRGRGLLSTLNRSIGGVRAGSAGLVHYVTDVGQQVLNGRRKHRVQQPTARFVAHRLAVADTHCTLTDAHCSGALALIDCDVEPASWRRYTGIGGRRVTLKPDLYAETATADDLVHGWFIEVDLGTESIPTLLKKCRDYEAYRRSGVEQDRHGSFPLVVWSISHRDLATAERRRRALRDAIANDHSLTPKLFRIIAPQQLTVTLQSGGQQ